MLDTTFHARVLELPVEEECDRRERLLAEARARRRRAEAVLRSLVEAKEQCERRLSSSSKPDAVKALRGDSSIERAIESTSRMIESLDRLIARAESMASPVVARL